MIQRSAYFAGQAMEKSSGSTGKATNYLTITILVTCLGMLNRYNYCMHAYSLFISFSLKCRLTIAYRVSWKI